ncbi:MAG: PQQ-binding-like beta-propeller repeat protein [Thermoleophilia bacterium]|nr:PQQ-binding-like beta-propeller repeat protein [Thermoleophilia bacterium]
MASRLTAVLAAALLSAAGGSAATPPEPSGWLTWGNGVARHNHTADRIAAARLRGWARRLDGPVTVQPLVVRGVPRRNDTTVYVATGGGSVYAFTADGRVRWRRQLARLRHDCPQLPTYGVTGTPVIDRRTRTLYAVDALGDLHALDLATGRSRQGWPVRLYTAPRRELVWGALTLLRGSVYAITASYCDGGPMEGKVIRVSLATRAVSSWMPVPPRLGGGGGMWGWGGLGYSARRGSLFVGTGNAFEGGENTGERFRESAGYGEHLVELSPDLTVRAAHHPPTLRGRADLDFSGAPVVFRARGCRELVTVPAKDGRLYAWRADAVERGVFWAADLRRFKPRYPLVAQHAYAPPLRSLYIATGMRLVRIALDARCRARVAWARPLPRWAFNGSPVVARGTVWLATYRSRALLGIHARTGLTVVERRLRGPVVAAPTVAGGRLYVGTFDGWLHGFQAR